MPSELVEVANRFRRMLLQEERAQARQLVNAYNEVWQETRQELRRLNEQIAAARAAGVEVNEAWLMQQARFQTLEAQTVAQINRYAQMAEGEIVQMQQIAMDIGGRQLNASLSALDIRVTLNRLPAGQVEALIGTLADGSPLSSLLADLGPMAGERMQSALIRGVALGWNPRKMERVARETHGQVLSHMLRIARTEGIRPYRDYSLMSYNANSDVVGGWIWLSAANDRTCASCWAMHGMRHTLRERLDDHPSGRCTMIPDVRGVEIEMPTGPALFQQMSQEQQRQVLGGAKFEAYQAGKIDLSDLVYRRRSRAWGTMRREASLEQALGG